MRRASLTVALLLALAACKAGGPGPDRVFVSDEGGSSVHVFDGASGREEGVLRTGARPRGMAVSADGTTLYVAASNADRIEAWDTHSLQRRRIYAAGSDPERFALTPDGRGLVTANYDGTLYLLEIP